MVDNVVLASRSEARYFHPTLAGEAQLSTNGAGRDTGLRFKLDMVPGHVKANGKVVRPHFRKVRVRDSEVKRIEERFQGPKTEQPSWELGEAAPQISCRTCYYHDWENPGTCKAFPEGIPEDIGYGRVLHIRPYEGDDGIEYDHWSRRLQEEYRSRAPEAEAADEEEEEDNDAF